MVDAAGVAVQCVEGLHHCCDEHDEGDDDENVDGHEGVVDAFVPADCWVLGAEDALGEEKVDGE